MNRHVLIALSLLLALLLGQQAIPDGTVCAADAEQAAEEDDFGEFDDEFGDEFDIEEAPGGRDPLRGYNRFMFHVNDKIYFWVLRPVAKVYGRVVPAPIRRSVQRCSKNLGAPARFVNNGLQCKMKGAGTELVRFGLNSTLGVLGLFDAADALFNLKDPPDEDFGQTLGVYGIGDGWPLVLPLLGPSSVRDAIGMVPDYFLDPISYVEPWEKATAIRLYEKTNFGSLHIGEYESLKEDALDPYTLLRDAYRQNREAKIRE